jgi:hypothetical protein
LQRVEKSGDLFESVLKLKQKLPPLTALSQTAPPRAASVRVAKAKSSRSTRPVRKAVAKPPKRKAKAR